jgi:Protein of unknown function (DUF2523)
MFGIFLSVLNSVLGFVLRSVIVKFALYFGLFFVTTEFLQVLTSAGIFPTAGSLSTSLGGIPGAVWYFLDLFNVSAGIPLVLSAYVTRFIIRRVPLIG